MDVYFSKIFLLFSKVFLWTELFFILMTSSKIAYLLIFLYKQHKYLTSARKLINTLKSWKDTTNHQIFAMICLFESGQN